MTEDGRKLWKEVFGDSDAWISAFVEKREPEGFFEYGQSGLLSMVFRYPITLFIEDERFSAMMIAGGATREDARGRGLYSRLLRKAAEGCDAILYPSDMARRLYSSMGFLTSGLSEAWLDGEGMDESLSYDIGKLDYIYMKAFREKGGIARDEYSWNEILDNRRLYLGKDSYAIGSDDAIIEAAGTDENGLRELLSRLRGRILFSERTLLGRILTPEGSIPSGMASSARLAGFYLPETY